MRIITDIHKLSMQEEIAEAKKVFQRINAIKAEKIRESEELDTLLDYQGRVETGVRSRLSWGWKIERDLRLGENSYDKNIVAYCFDWFAKNSNKKSRSAFEYMPRVEQFMKDIGGFKDKLVLMMEEASEQEETGFSPLRAYVAQMLGMPEIKTGDRENLPKTSINISVPVIHKINFDRLTGWKQEEVRGVFYLDPKFFSFDFASINQHRDGFYIKVMPCEYYAMHPFRQNFLYFGNDLVRSEVNANQFVAHVKTPEF